MLKLDQLGVIIHVAKAAAGCYNLLFKNIILW